MKVHFSLEEKHTHETKEILINISHLLTVYFLFFIALVAVVPIPSLNSVHTRIRKMKALFENFSSSRILCIIKKKDK